MFFSYNKLKELASLNDKITLEDVKKAINSIGFEVESDHKPYDVEGVKFGKVLETSKNPNGDKLTVCKIQFSDKVRTIQTAATNVREGNVVVAFVPGSRSGKMTYEPKELKGIMSEGMLSSLNEFGAQGDLYRAEHVDGITLYDNEVSDLTIDPIKYLGLDDHIIEIKILSNRADANSYLIMARELAAYFGTKAKELVQNKETFKTDIKVKKGDEKNIAFLEVKKTFNISIPEQLLLARSGIKSINDAVDLTNLTLIMTGQPAHVYNKEDVKGTFVVSHANGKEVVFGNKEVELANTLVVKNDNNVVSIAGVIGIEKYSVKPEHNNLVIELGQFDIKDIRNSIRTTKVNNHTMNQSAKETSEGRILLALSYLRSKLNDFSNVVNFDESKVKSSTIKFDINKLISLAGSDITKDSKYKSAIDSLKSLGIDVSNNEVVVPSYRYDIKNQNDVAEEVFRFYGYDNFKPEAPSLKASQIMKQNHFKHSVRGYGFSEVVTYSLISKELNVFNPFDFKKNVELSTFVSKEREVIRNSQLQSMLEITSYHDKRKATRLSLFSVGQINDNVKTLIVSSNEFPFQVIQMFLTNMFDGITFERKEFDVLHPNMSALIMKDKKVIGWIGKVNPSFNDSEHIFAEVILQNNEDKDKFVEYDSLPMKSKDFTIPIKVKEDISKHIDKYINSGAFDVYVIDTFVKDEINNVTIRVIGDEKMIDKLN